MVRNLTEGTPWRQIMVLVLPLLLGNMFQASYNLVDTMIVGRFVGPEALAGVGSGFAGFPFCQCAAHWAFCGVFHCGIPVVRRWPGKGTACGGVHRGVDVSGRGCCAHPVGQLLVDPFLTVLRTPIEDYAFAEVYLRTILCGLVCNVFYNQLSGLLRGLGNTQMPLYILIFSCCVNAGLDLMFVCVFSLGVMGAGFATIFAEGLAAALTALYIRKAVPQLRLCGAWCCDGGMFSAILRFGLPMGLQQASISFGHVLMQGLINPFGTALIAGYTAAVKVDTFAVMPILSPWLSSVHLCCTECRSRRFLVECAKATEPVV